MGREWRRRFPKAPKADIREFLDLFIAAFGFGESRRLRFSPGDRVMEVYRALYPFPKMMADSMELESFITRVQERYGVDLLPLWREDVTLGELFAYARTDLA
jgi:cystathionine beta-lyase family protein involved in aluminum resistance